MFHALAITASHALFVNQILALTLIKIVEPAMRQLIATKTLLVRDTEDSYH